MKQPKLCKNCYYSDTNASLKFGLVKWRHTCRNNSRPKDCKGRLKKELNTLFDIYSGLESLMYTGNGEPIFFNLNEKEVDEFCKDNKINTADFLKGGFFNGFWLKSNVVGKGDKKWRKYL